MALREIEEGFIDASILKQKEEPEEMLLEYGDFEDTSAPELPVAPETE